MRLQDTRRQDITDLFLGCFTSTFVTLNQQAPSPIYGDYRLLCIALERIAIGYHLPKDDGNLSVGRDSKRQFHSPTSTGSSSKAYTHHSFTHRTRS